MDLAIIKKIEDMIGYGYIVLRQFPKSEKFVLGADIRQSMIELLSLAVRCAKRYHKKTSLQDMEIASKNGRALDFLGYKILPNSRKLRKNSIARLKKKISVLHEKYSAGLIDFRAVRLAMASNIAHASKANSNGILSKLLSKPFVRSAT